MIAVMGLMVGCYILTRMFNLIIDRKVHAVTVIFAGITILATMAVMAYFILGPSLPNLGR